MQFVFVREVIGFWHRLDAVLNTGTQCSNKNIGNDISQCASVSVVCSGESSIQTAVLLQLVGRWNNKRCTVHSSKKASLAKSNYRSPALCRA